MNKNLVVSGSVDINAPLSRVWEVLTNPTLIKEYLYGTETITDWKPGSDIIFQGEYQGEKYRDKGTILEIEPNEKITYSYWSAFTGLEDEPENYSIVSYTLEPGDDNQTELTWTQKGFANKEAKKHSEEGMETLLDQIKQIAER